MNASSNWVEITDGKHKGKTLRFVKRTNRRVGVELDNGQLVYLQPDRVRNIETQKLTLSHPKEEVIGSSSTDENVTPKLVSSAIEPCVPEYTKWVKIIDGKHKGKKLQFVKRTAKCVGVQLDNEKVVYLRPDHVKNVEKHSHPQEGANALPSNDIVVQPCVPEYTKWVKIIDGKHKGKKLQFVKRTAKCVGVQLNHEKVIYLRPDHVKNIETENEEEQTPSDPKEDVNTLPSNGVVNTKPVSPLLEAEPIVPECTMYTDWVKIIGGKHKGKTLRFVKRTTKCVGVELDNEKVVYLQPDNVENIETEQESNSFHLKDDVNTLSNSDITTSRPVSPADEPDVPEYTMYTKWVTIIGGKHKGKKLQFVKRTDKRVGVQLDHEKVVYLEPDHVKNIKTEELEPTPSHSSEDVIPLKRASLLEDEDSYSFVSAVESLDYERDAYVDDDDGFFTVTGNPSQTFTSSSPCSIIIKQGVHAGKQATFLNHTPKRSAVNLEGDSKIRYLSPDSLGPVLTKSTTMTDQNDPMVQAIRHHLPSNCSIQNVTDETVKRTLFGVIFGADSPIFFDLDTASVAKLPHTFKYEGQTFHLAAIKMHTKAKALTCVYILAPTGEYVANSLLRIGSFDKLAPRKTGARLELLLSTTAQENHIHKLLSSMFCCIPEQGNVGCGFIPRSMIDDLMGQPSPKVCALQVRIVIPCMGIFKGVLFEKQGINKIELPSSMQKVDAAINADKNVAWLMINKTGIYPYPVRVQQAENRFQDKKDFPIMARWMLNQKGVSQTYLQQPNGKHSNLLGVADPTNAIPPGCVFITGIHTTNQLDNFPDKVIISRFPMTEASDGRLLPILREKPNTMTSAQWSFLCSKPFGIVVFGNPAPGDRPMPEQIAQGDLDGDGYFVTWDQTIVQDATIGDRALFASKTVESLSIDWWPASQEYMANIEERKQSQKVIGRLHDCWLRNLERGFQHDAVLFGRAFKAALVSAKHGGKVGLPTRLRSQIPRYLHRYLMPPKADE